MKTHRRKTSPYDVRPEWGLSEIELARLGTYNSEHARGLIHTPEWKAKMADLQRRFETRKRTA